MYIESIAIAVTLVECKLLSFEVRNNESERRHQDCYTMRIFRGLLVYREPFRKQYACSYVV
jgi:hypothetical protein